MSQRSRRRKEEQARRRSRLRVAAAVGVLALLVAFAVLAFGADDSNDGSEEGTADVTMTEFAFAPNPIVVGGGGDTTIVVANEGEVAHNLVIPELDLGTPDLEPGERAELDLADQPRGSYRVLCDLLGHAAEGMEAELILQ